MQIITAKDKSSGTRLDQAIKRGNIIVLIYADWCPHCVEFKPEWDKFKKAMRNSQCSIGEVEQTYLEHVPSAKAQGYPTIKFYKSPASAIGASNKGKISVTKTVKRPYLGRVPIKNNPFAKTIMERAEAADLEFNSDAGVSNARHNDDSASNEIVFEGQRSVDTLVKFANSNTNNTPSSNKHRGNGKDKKAKRANKSKNSKKGKQTKKAKKTVTTSKKAKKPAATSRTVSKKYREEKTKRDPVVMQELNSNFADMAVNA